MQTGHTRSWCPPTQSLIDALSRADAQTAYSGSFLSPMAQQSSPADRSTDTQPSSSRPSVVSRQPLRKDLAALTCDQARHLFYAYRQETTRPIVPIDEEALWDAIDQTKSNRTSEIRKTQPDVYALLLVVCASMVILLPPTYSITLGLLSKSEELGLLMDAWETEAFDALDELDMFSKPSLIGVQVMALYQLNLSHR